MRTFILHPMIVLAVLVTLTLLAVHGMDENDLNHVFDPVMLSITVLAYTFAVVVILTRTRLRMWTWLGAGMVATFTADAMLYVYLLRGRVDWDFPAGDIWVPVIESHWWLETVRALLFVGGPSIIAGLLMEWKIDRDAQRYRLEKNGGET